MSSTSTTAARRRRLGGLLRPAALGASLLAAAGLVAACGKGSSDTKSASATFVAAIPALPPTLDPTLFSGGTRPYFGFLDSFLFNFKSTSCSTALSANDLVGNLAKSWKASADGKSYDIVLNGYELGGGSLRIYDPQMQRRVFEILGLDR